MVRPCRYDYSMIHKAGAWKERFLEKNGTFISDKKHFTLRDCSEVLFQTAKKPWKEVVKVLDLQTIIHSVNRQVQMSKKVTSYQLGTLLINMGKMSKLNGISRERKQNLISKLTEQITKEGVVFTNQDLSNAYQICKSLNLEEQKDQELLRALSIHLKLRISSMNSTEISRCHSAIYHLDSNHQLVKEAALLLKDNINLDHFDCKKATFLLREGKNDQVFNWLKTPQQVDQSYIPSLVYYHYLYQVKPPQWLLEKEESLNLNTRPGSITEKSIKQEIEQMKLPYDVKFNHYLYGLEMDIFIPSQKGSKRGINKEFDGPQHSQLYNQKKDQQRDAFLKSQGVSVQRFTTVHELLKSF